MYTVWLYSKQETVRLLLQIIDPLGVQPRSKGKLRRRIYSNPGPDFKWHIDIDKLNPYGICINGCIYGYSRQIIWLEAFKTNSDPGMGLIQYVNILQSYTPVRFIYPNEIYIHLQIISISFSLSLQSLHLIYQQVQQFVRTISYSSEQILINWPLYAAVIYLFIKK